MITRRRDTIPTIIFDLDDTLIKTNKIYRNARSEFAAIIIKQGFPAEECLEKLDEIDIEHVRQQGFAIERYPLSMVKTYQFYCQKFDKKIDKEMEKKVAQIGWRVFEQIPEPVEGVNMVLDTLKERYTLILATMGDPKTQHYKIDHSGLKRYFKAVHILSYKTPEEYQEILAEHNLEKEKTWLVGNSIRSDLNPGLKLGLNCILIPASTWKFEEEKPISDQYIQVDTLVEVLHYL